MVGARRPAEPGQGSTEGYAKRERARESERPSKRTRCSEPELAEPLLADTLPTDMLLEPCLKGPVGLW